MHKSKTLTNFLNGLQYLIIGATSAYAASIDLCQQHLSYDTIRKEQEIGRIVSSENGNYFVYEWSRPYLVRNNNPSIAEKGCATKTTLFLVNTKDPRATSEYLILPSERATYSLGNLSPSGAKVGFYKLDRDSNEAHLGVANIEFGIFPALIWAKVPVDKTCINKPAVWATENTIIYPGMRKGESTLLIMNLYDGSIANCTGEQERFYEENVRVPERRPPNMGLAEAARSKDGKLIVLIEDTSEKLELRFRREQSERLLFCNRRASGKLVAQEDIDAGKQAAARFTKGE